MGKELMNLENFNCKLIPLTPIHIGSGYEIEPFDYVIKNDTFYRINTMEIFENLSDKERTIFTQKIEEGIISFRTFIRDIYKEEWGYIYKSDVNMAFSEKYNQKLAGSKNKNENSEFVVKEFMGGLRGKFIPGSTLKGAFRGAHIYDKADELDYKLERNLSYKTFPIKYVSEPNFYKATDKDKSVTLKAFDMTNLNPFIDPFKRLTISDTIQVVNNTKIVEVKRISIDKTSKYFKQGSSDYLEVLKSKYADSYEEPLEFSLSTRYLEKIGKDLIKNHYENKGRSFGEIVTFNPFEFLDALNAKFKDIIEEEIIFYNKSNNADIKNFYKELKAESESLEDNEAIIRIGKGSGFATFTHLLKSNNMHIRQASRILAEEKYPMGWAKIVIE